ncbi:hypothetical protein EHP00_1233 [Ecytonucleospora hepatopenaei]|uniref:Uncharacterized protein n=1 Tax=Ecytonucleospora hepatopenaei TaxID=646526 RepID=A0A1W0E3H4_9MICR|nr:hypothetical protein EHP00_1233 [Ecytonucleospora hepatopenaei]
MNFSIWHWFSNWNTYKIKSKTPLLVFPKYDVKSKNEIKCELEFILHKDIPLKIEETEFTLFDNCYVDDCIATNISVVSIYVSPAFLRAYKNPNCTFRSAFSNRELRINNLKGCFLQFVKGQLMIDYKRNKKVKYIAKGNRTIDLFDITKQKVGDISTANTQLLLDHIDQISLFTQEYLNLIDDVPRVVNGENGLLFKAKTCFNIYGIHDQNNVIKPNETVPGRIQRTFEIGKDVIYYTWEKTKNIASKLKENKPKCLNLQNIQIVEKNIDISSEKEDSNNSDDLNKSDNLNNSKDCGKSSKKAEQNKNNNTSDNKSSKPNELFTHKKPISFIKTGHNANRLLFINMILYLCMFLCFLIIFYAHKILLKKNKKKGII